MKTKKLSLFKILGILLALSLLCALPPATATAASYPTKLLRIIAPYSPGGPSDTLGRLIATALSERLGVQVLLENRPGAGAVIGTELAAKSKPDGYTLLIVTGGHTVQPAFHKIPYDPAKSFTALARVGTGPFVLTVHSSVPATSVKEFIALAKQKPGELVFASSGAGASTHIATELFKITADIDFKIVQFKGAGPAVIDEVGGHSQASILSLITPLPHIKSGKLRALATCGAKRSALLPDVPTVAETLPGFEISQWYGMLAPAGLPTPIVERLANEFKEILNSEDMKKRFLMQGVEAEYMGLAEFGPFLENDVAKWKAVVKKANIRLDK
ncbi:MAG: tripartite tricarboxylate transporter substrate binding protein [Pseudomonadota bacterium]